MTDAETTERTDAAEDVDTTAPVDDLEERLVAEGEIAGDYLEELLDLLDFDGDIDLDVEGDRAVVSIDGGSDLNKLVGRKGEVHIHVPYLTGTPHETVFRWYHEGLDAFRDTVLGSDTFH